ncbi:phytoene desaturase family protein [Chloroflexota bacterium]
MHNNRALVIGAGIGGISTAAKLAREGYQVSVLEKNEIPGGRCGKMEIQGHHFDTGPTLFLMPDLYREAFLNLGERLEDHLELRRVDPTYQIHYADGLDLTLTNDLHVMQAQLEAIEPGSYRQYLRYLQEGYFHYKASLDTVVRRDFRQAFDFFNPKNLILMLRLKALTKHYKNISRFFKDERLKFAFIFQNLYMGVHPYQAPALFSLLQHTEFSDGVWFPIGGMNSIIEALVHIAEKNGVTFHYKTIVDQILIENQRAIGVGLKNGKKLLGDVVVANADLPYIYRELLPEDGNPRRFSEKKHGCSALVFYWGLKKRYPQLGPHNLFLAKDIRGGFDQIFNELSLSKEPSFYVHAPVRLDSSLAPEGQDTLTVAVPVPHLDEKNPQDWKSLKAQSRRYILSRFREVGISDLDEHIKFEVSYSPEDWKKRFNLTKGSAHGLSHEILQMGYLRPKNQHDVYRNLFFVGASTHPGTGLPSVLVSAKHVSDRILETSMVPHLEFSGSAVPAIE